MWRSHLEHESECDRNHHQTSKPGCTGFIPSWKRGHCTLYWIERSRKKHGADSYILTSLWEHRDQVAMRSESLSLGARCRDGCLPHDSNHWKGKPCWMPNPLMLLLWPQTRKCGWKTKDELGDFESSSCQYYDAFFKTGSDGWTSRWQHKARRKSKPSTSISWHDSLNKNTPHATSHCCQI